MKFPWRILVSLSFIGLLVYFMRDETPVIISTIKSADKPLLALSTVLFLATVLILAKRLDLIFSAEDAKLGFAQAVNLTFIGYFFNNFLPSSVGGDIVKAMCASRVTKEPVKSVTSVLMDRIFGLLTFVLIPSITFAFVAGDVGDRRVPFIIYGLLAASLFGALLLFNRSFARRFSFVESLLRLVRLDIKARKIYDGLHAFGRHRWTALGAMALSLAGQATSIYVTYLMATALGAKPSFMAFFMLVPIIHLISMVPVSLNGLGLREGAFVFVLQGQIGDHAALALSILWLAMLLLTSLIGGLIYLFRHDYHIQFKKAVSVESL
jgi:hypothetical protein